MRASILASSLLVVIVAACSGPASDPETPSPDRPAVAVPEPISPGRYCAVEAVEGLGQAIAEATVTGADETLRLAVGRTMPDSPQVLEVGPEPAQVDSDGRIFLSFEDGWANRGLATLTPSGALSLRIVTASSDPSGANVRRNYGDFQLTSEACADISPPA